MTTAAVLLCALLVGASTVVADGAFSATYTPAAPGDDPSVTGTLELTVGDDGDSINYRAALFNVFEITGVHLHLSGNSSGGLFGGPLVLALTNTTAANGEAPVSSSGDAPLVQSGTKTGQDLRDNFMAPMVATRLGELGLPGGPPTSVAELVQLINLGVIYTDVHSTERVSPQGVTRGWVRPVGKGGYGGYGTPGGYGH